ncbi:hypothetical protein LR48_Vigan05g154500 [Vigna angularis]|uniref:Uncharacterized protein n=1 Tax=Phaseolus angularis TaxID=3914 RepID=A0A0L9UM39_PHAAN|nr:hypothetical protein LR48_Vigan05g154500 [Vigna angularis]
MGLCILHLNPKGTRGTPESLISSAHAHQPQPPSNQPSQVAVKGVASTAFQIKSTKIRETNSLMTKVLKLKDQLSEAEKEIQRLLESGDRVPSNSCSSSQSQSESQSMEAMDPPFFMVFEVDGYDDDVFYGPETHCMNALEWINLYM